MSTRAGAYGQEDVVTGEAVAVEVPFAGLPARAASGAIDAVATLLLVGGLGLAGSRIFAGTSEAVQATVGILVLVLLLVGLPTVLETALSGRTLGKLVLGLQTVRADGGPVRFRHALTRALVGFVEVWLTMYLPAFVSELVSPRGQRLGDHAAGTYVVVRRRSVRVSPPPVMPPALAGWAAMADIAALPGGLALAVRSYLSRSHEMSPAGREAVGRQLLAEVLQHVSPAPPFGAPRDAVLAAVIADRSRRDLQRLQRADDLRRRVLAPDPLAPSDPALPHA